MVSDSFLFRYEMTLYGIGYDDVNDVLFVGEQFINNADLTEWFIPHEAPSLLVTLLQEPNGTRYVGATFAWVSHLVAYYWNNTIPNPCPVSFFADLADLGFADPDSIIWSGDRGDFDTALEMHRQARELIGRVEFVPEAILERLRENLPLEKSMTH